MSTRRFTRTRSPIVCAERRTRSCSHPRCPGSAQLSASALGWTVDERLFQDTLTRVRACLRRNRPALFAGSAHATNVPSGCSITGVVQPLSWRRSNTARWQPSGSIALTQGPHRRRAGLLLGRADGLNMTGIVAADPCCSRRTGGASHFLRALAKSSFRRSLGPCNSTAHCGSVNEVTSSPSLLVHRLLPRLPGCEHRRCEQYTSDRLNSPLISRRTSPRRRWIQRWQIASNVPPHFNRGS